MSLALRNRGMRYGRIVETVKTLTRAPSVYILDLLLLSSKAVPSPMPPILALAAPQAWGERRAGELNVHLTAARERLSSLQQA